jgi:thiamine-monophosphate kinase
MDFDNTADTELVELGEFGLIKHLTQHIEINHKSTKTGVGDDAAVIDNDNLQTVVSTDMLVEGVHFDLTYVPLRHLGYKSVVVNLSDIYAMNAEPRQILVSIAISNRFRLDAIEELYAGMLMACKKYNIDLVGGDTTSSRSGLIINITAIGAAKKEDLVYRSGAKETNLLCVSGDLGGAYMGLQVLEREKSVFTENPKLQPDLEGKDYILERQLKPEARKDIIELLKSLGVKPTAMIDVSDGLASELLHLADQSFVGFDVYEEKIPVDPQVARVASEFNLDHTTCALNGGEDYELLFTIKQKDYDKIKGNPNLSVIGHVTPDGAGVHLITRAGDRIPLQAQGWDALKES